ncbi:hypothetical protein SFCCH060_3973 [Shigella flexneri CCH060]|uniref:Uncharacterized protein n=1 Tax=Shigella flexneri CCH060 TaxID=754091 RepID=A0A6N3QY55_SHIFL|nr:hypothetical protein SFCCH060_4876 [Shigella flexneri CCH060]EIQ06379.1 hypothetical protein SFCCH060_3973 [Shigella flexneri CCH060]
MLLHLCWKQQKNQVQVVLENEISFHLSSLIEHLLHPV